MNIISLVLSIIAFIVAICSFIFRKPGKDGLNGNWGPQGDKGEKGDSPIFKIMEGNLYVAYLNPETGQQVSDWLKLGYIVGPKGDTGNNGLDGKDGEVILKEAGDLTGTDIEKLLQKKKYLRLPSTQITALAFHENEPK